MKKSLSSGFFLSLTILLGGLVPAQNSPPASDGGLAQILQPYVDKHIVAGSLVLVASKDRILDLETAGYADLATRKPMTADSLFAIASMGKPIAATAFMMLVDEGKVSVDDPVEKYLPDFKDKVIVDPKDPPIRPTRPSTRFSFVIFSPTPAVFLIPRRRKNHPGTPVRSARPRPFMPVCRCSSSRARSIPIPARA
jgi:CubicO group peptidase (beta-lactamase class C family)